jgi:hypothetical protein
LNLLLFEAKRWTFDGSGDGEDLFCYEVILRAVMVERDDVDGEIEIEWCNFMMILENCLNLNEVFETWFLLKHNFQLPKNLQNLLICFLHLGKPW